MKSFIRILLLLNVLSTGWGQEIMTAARFQKIASSAGDSVPLMPQLAALPFWTNSVVNIVMNYASGKEFSEELTQSTKTVEGKYLVFTAYSKFYRQTMSSILTYDAKASALKTYGLFGKVVTEGAVIYDTDKKIYAITSTYGEGFKEITIGSYTTQESSERTQVFQNGVLFMTRQVKSRVAAAN